MKTAGLYGLVILDSVAVVFLIEVAAASRDAENIEQPNVGFPILAAVAVAALIAAVVGGRSGRSRALVIGLLLVPLVALVVASLLPQDTAA